MDAGARLESTDLVAALQQFEKAKQLDPSLGAADQAIGRVRLKMKTEGTAAFNRGKLNDNLDRIDQAIAAYQIAVKYLPDDDPNKAQAKTRLAALQGK